MIARPCRVPGCPGIATHRGYCEDHLEEAREAEAQRRARADAQRPTAAQRGYDGRWQRRRHAYLVRHPLCRQCELDGRVTAASVVDHVIPHRGERWLFDAEINWQALCAPCHNRKSQSERGGFTGLMYPIGITPMRMRATVVAGAPASGKSTYARTHAEPGDVILDLDQIITEISGQRPRDRDWGWLRAGLEQRNHLLDGLTSGRIEMADGARLWFIVTAARPAERWFWSQVLATADVRLMPTDQATCEARLRADATRALVLGEQLDAVSRWHHVFEPWSGDRPA